MFEIVPHTSDVRVHLKAASIEELFSDGVRAMMTVLDAHPQPDSTAVRRTVRIESADLTTLLVDFLNEILGLATIRGEAFDGLRFHSLTSSALDAELAATPATFGDEIKAVTYHEAEIVQNEDRSWSTLLVFDL